MRDPSIHLKLSDLKLVISKIAPELSLSNKQVKLLADAILVHGKHLSCSHRAIQTNKKIEAKVDKMLMSSRDSAGQFSLMLSRLRKSILKHRGIKHIRPSDKDWLVVKELAGLAGEFCKEFGLSIKQGFKEYITIALNKMETGYGLNKMPRLNQYIYDYYRAQKIITSDLHPSLTRELFEAYRVKILEAVGFCTDYSKDPQQYLYFVKAKEELRKLPGITPKIYVEAQFGGLSWANAIPTPSQLIGVNAITRLQKYLSENQIKVNSSARKINWAKIRQE